jgi:predicted DNA binding protein
MWVTKIRLVDKKCIWATRCKKFGIYDYQYPLGFYKVKEGLALIMYHILEGKDKDIKYYIKDVKKDKRIKKLEVKKNFIVSLAIEKRTKKELKAFEALYNKKLIYVKPGINYPDGSETWEIASFDRKDITKLINFIEKYYQGELLFLKQIKVPKIFIPQIMPELTEKQWEAFKIASEQGYYEFPRKTNLHKLAKLAKISRPTFEEHLRKAEIKLLKFMKELIE